jgi:hypothetical protein
MRTVLAVVLLACFVVAPAAHYQQAAPANESPSQFYLRYRAAVPAATAVEQVVAFWSADQRTDFNAAPANHRPGLNEIKPVFQAVSNVKVLKESTTPNTATIQAEATMNGKPVHATIQLTRENGAWKVASGPEDWE